MREPILNTIWGLNIVINGKFSQPYSLSGSFLSNTHDFLIRWKITWVDRHIQTIILVYENIYLIWVTDALNWPQEYTVQLRASGGAIYHLWSFLLKKNDMENQKLKVSKAKHEQNQERSKTKKFPNICLVLNLDVHLIFDQVAVMLRKLLYTMQCNEKF